MSTISVLLLFIMVFLLRAYPSIRYRYAGSDTYYHLTVSEIIRKNSFKLPDSIENFTAGGPYSYPPGLHFFMALLPGKSGLYRYISPFMDTVQAMWSTPNRRLAALEQGWWALERTGAGLALVRGRKLTVCNTRFRELGRSTARAGWLRLDPTSADAETKPAPLHTLIMREAAAIYESGVSAATRRYKLADGGAIAVP